VTNAGTALRQFFTIRSGDSYYAVGSQPTFPPRTLIYDVTTPVTPVQIANRSGTAYGILEYAKDDVRQRVATIALDGMLRVHTFAAFIAGDAPLATYTATAGHFMGVAFDDAGALWVTEANQISAPNLLWKLSGPAFTKTTYDVYGETFVPRAMHAGGGYVVVSGTGPLGEDTKILQIMGGAPQLLDTGNYLRNYYHRAPSGYADPGGRVTKTLPRVVAQGEDVYLFYSAEGLGDVYELPAIAPEIYSMTPVSGPPAGGTIVTIDGMNFGDEVDVTFDGIDAVTEIVSNGRLRVTAPPHAPGVVAVEVVAGDFTLPSLSFTYELKTPANLNATATSSTSISLSWSPVNGATEYEVFRRASDGTWTSIGVPAVTNFTDGGRTPDTTSVYRVRARDASGYTSNFTTPVLATTMTIAEVPAAGMRILGSHLTDVRRSVNAVRAAAGLAPATFTAGMTIRAVQLTELRAALTEALTALGMATPVFTDASLVGVKVKAVHFAELLSSAL
ncbi:MAG: IPT/TIG domain-containing protein, partial [Thermoanaerobaculia bacterium]